MRELRAMWLVDAELSGSVPAKITLQPVKHTLPRGTVAPAAKTKSSTLFARQLGTGKTQVAAEQALWELIE